MLSEAVFEIKQAFPRYTWVGIYLLEQDELALETFLGKPTEHVRIPIDKGICGASAKQRQTLLVNDVCRDDRYISCDIAVKSEIVIPMIHAGRVLGVLDIDSNHRNAFSENDAHVLEEAVKLIVDAFPGITK